MSKLRTVVPTLLLVLGFAASAFGAAPTMPPVKSPLEIDPFASVVAYAASHGIAVQGVETAGPTSTPQPGDEVVYLLSLLQRTDMQQWLVRITAGRPDPKDGKTKPIPDDTIYTSTGQELRYTNTPAVLDLEFIGPFTATTANDAKILIRRGHTVVSAESLQTGLARYCEGSLGVAERLKAAGIEHPVFYGSGSRPKADVIEAGRKQAAAFGLTPEEERLAFSVYFALRSFYFAASEVQGCREVLEQVLQKPSLWSVASNFGLNTNFKYGWQEVGTLTPGLAPVSSPVFVLPVKLSINDQPALQAMLAVTSTEPPLRNCAGIVALSIVHPTNTDKRVALRLLSAHPAKN
ncbi:MAG TPA: hypothetical protein VFJ90_06530 [Candidatus Didemnitutus sp.]|nr:hypothetical protein [Candidatus Didemnitutus sp.]